MPVQWLDIVILAILAFAGFAGFKNGFLREIIGTVALLLGILGSIVLADYGVRFLTEEMNFVSPFVPTLSYIIVFLAVFLTVYALGRLVNMLINVTLLGVVNRIIGVLFSVLKFSLGLSVVLWLVNISGMLEVSIHEYSQITPYLEPLAPETLAFITEYTSGLENLIPSVEEYFDQFKSSIIPEGFPI
jgi:membrane protein required for colicin V production